LSRTPILLLVALLPSVARAEPPKPAPIRCLERWYAVKGEFAEGKWGIVVAGKRIPFDDGKAKSFEERLAAPDVEDAFAQRYRAGAIRPVAAVDEDPGRVRLDAAFTATYGAKASAVDVVKIQFLDQSLQVNRKVAPAFARVAARLARAVAADPSLAPFLKKLGGTFVWRNIAGTDRPSAHSYGVSIDVNVERSNYWRWQRPPEPVKWVNRIPQAIVDAFEAEGFIWGGRWYHYDTMHFEYRPELLDPACYPGGA
jgi:D-alanyl-D-alanine carboxypeptidase